MSKEKKQWEIIPHFHQIADTGDYDGCYEITNGSISILTKDDGDDGLEEIINALNNSGCEFQLNDEKEFELYIANNDKKQIIEASQNLISQLGNETLSESSVKALNSLKELLNYLGAPQQLNSEEDLYKDLPF